MHSFSPVEKLGMQGKGFEPDFTGEKMKLTSVEPKWCRERMISSSNHSYLFSHRAYNGG